MIEGWGCSGVDGSQRDNRFPTLNLHQPRLQERPLELRKQTCSFFLPPENPDKASAMFCNDLDAATLPKVVSSPFLDFNSVHDPTPKPLRTPSFNVVGWGLAASHPTRLPLPSCSLVSPLKLCSYRCWINGAPLKNTQWGSIIHPRASSPPRSSPCLQLLHHLHPRELGSLPRPSSFSIMCVFARPCFPLFVPQVTPLVLSSVEREFFPFSSSPDSPGIFLSKSKAPLPP